MSAVIMGEAWEAFVVIAEDIAWVVFWLLGVDRSDVADDGAGGWFALPTRAVDR